jgi:hypothetical protein
MPPRKNKSTDRDTKNNKRGVRVDMSFVKYVVGVCAWTPPHIYVFLVLLLGPKTAAFSGVGGSTLQGNDQAGPNKKVVFNSFSGTSPAPHVKC